MIGQENATILKIDVIQEPVGFDLVTGEAIFETRETSLSFRVSLEKDTVEPIVGVLPGKDKTEQLIYGRASITEKPSWFTPGSQLTIRFDSGFETLCYVYFSIPSRLGLDSFFGLPIEVVMNY